MTPLDNVQKIREIDKRNMQSLLTGFPKQLEEALAIGRRFEVSKASYRRAENICFAGLGGSAIGADLIKNYSEGKVEIPVLVHRGYELPRFVNDRTLLIVSSYSGETEETLSSFYEGVKRRAKIVTITSNGRLEKESVRRRFPCLKIPTGYPPRAALGFSLVPLLVFLHKIGKISFDEREVFESVQLLGKLERVEYGVGVPERSNLAKRMAKEFFGRLVFVYAPSSPLEAVALRWRAQMEENAKTLATHHVLPEMNHNEILGWSGPDGLFRKFVALFLRDREEHERVAHRLRITNELIRKEGVRTLEVFSKGRSLLARIFSLIYLGDFTSFYLSILNGVDPTPVPMIDYLKKRLSKL